MWGVLVMQNVLSFLFVASFLCEPGMATVREDGAVWLRVSAESEGAISDAPLPAISASLEVPSEEPLHVPETRRSRTLSWDPFATAFEPLFDVPTPQDRGESARIKLRERAWANLRRAIMAELARRLREEEKKVGGEVRVSAAGASEHEESRIVFPDPALEEVEAVWREDEDDGNIPLRRYACSVPPEVGDTFRPTLDDDAHTPFRFTRSAQGDDQENPLKKILPDLNKIVLLEVMAALKTFTDHRREEEEPVHRLFDWGIEGLDKILDLSADDNNHTEEEVVHGKVNAHSHGRSHGLSHAQTARLSSDSTFALPNFELSDFSCRLASEARQRVEDRIRFYLDNELLARGSSAESFVAHLKAGGKKVLPQVTEVVADTVHDVVHTLLVRLEKEKKRADSTMDMLVEILKAKMIEHREVMAQIGKLCSHCLGGAIAAAVLEREELKGAGEADSSPSVNVLHAHRQEGKR